MVLIRATEACRGLVGPLTRLTPESLHVFLHDFRRTNAVLMVRKLMAHEQERQDKSLKRSPLQSTATCPCRMPWCSWRTTTTPTKRENREKEREEIARKAAKMADDVLVREADREAHPVSLLTAITLLSENRCFTPPCPPPAA